MSDLTGFLELLDLVGDLHAKVQYLVDSWPGGLPDGGITFPDGEFWPVTEKEPSDG